MVKTSLRNALTVIGCLTALAVVVLIILSFKQVYSWFESKKGPEIVKSEITVEKIEKLNDLVVNRVNIAEVLAVREDNYFGSWLIKGDALISINLSKAKIQDQDPVKRSAQIILPQPHVLQARVDHNRTVTWSVEKDNWKASFGFGDSGKVRDSAMKHAQELIEQTAQSSEYMKGSRERAEHLIHNFFAELNWNVEILWSKE